MSLPATQISSIEKVLMVGDLSALTSDQRVSYYKSVCESLGLNPLTKPFEFITLNGKLVMYARRECTEQLRKLYNVSIKIVSREVINDVYVVTAQARFPDGREDESTGAVNISNLKGDALANAYLKCETKAKRRVTLSICGLGMLDEMEVDSIPKEEKRAKSEALNPSEIREKRIDNMLAFFAKHDISTTDIGNKYGVTGRDELTNEDIDELAKIASEISKGLKKKEDYFGEPEYEETF